ncbi:MAG: ABC transporter permease [Spirochaetes bacterium]|nr:ABC transporter permease [Spirochaetota bacterium]
MKSLKAQYQSFSRNTLFMPLLLTLVLIVINLVMQPNFLEARVIRLNILTFSPLMLVAMGQAIILIGGNLDLSVGFGVSLLNCFVAINMSLEQGMAGHNALVLATGLVIAVAMGLVNGVIVGMFKVPSFIATFATSFIWLGIAIMIAPIPGGAVTPQFAQFFKASVGPANVMLLIIVIAMCAWQAIRHFRTGRYIYAIGSSWEASYANGIRVRRITLASFAIGWCYVFLGTLALTAQTRAGDSALGEPFALNSIAAAVIGGVSLTGGSGSPVGAALGAITLSIILNIIYFSGLPTSLQVLVRGIIIIAALSATMLAKNARARMKS